MHAIITAIGALIVVEGILFIINPLLMRKLIEFFIKGKLIYIAGVIRVILAILFLTLASQCAHPWLIILFGIAFLIGAIVIFALELEKIKNMLRWWLTQKDYMIRIVGSIAAILGLLIIYGSIIKWP